MDLFLKMGYQWNEQGKTWEILSSYFWPCELHPIRKVRQDDQTRRQDRLWDSVTLPATLKDGGLDYEWPRVRVVMGGWGLGGSNGELIETQLWTAVVKKREQRDWWGSTQGGGGWQHIILNDRSLVLASCLLVAHLFPPNWPLLRLNISYQKTAQHMPHTHS